MIIWNSKSKEEGIPEFPELGRRAWRWAIVLHSWNRGVSLNLEQQVLFKNEDWGPANNYYGFSITKHFSLGSSHIYYDGPHCGFSFGFLHINWSHHWCDKCMPLGLEGEQ